MTPALARWWDGGGCRFGGRTLGDRSVVGCSISSQQRTCSDARRCRLTAAWSPFTQALAYKDHLPYLLRHCLPMRIQHQQGQDHGDQESAAGQPDLRDAVSKKEAPECSVRAATARQRRIESECMARAAL